MMQKTVLRRALTVAAVFLATVISSLLLPILLPISLAIDLVRFSASRTPAMATRLVAFAWVYLMGEVWAVVTLGAIGLLRPPRSIAITYRLQGSWARWNYTAFRIIFDVRFVVSGVESAHPPPVIVLARHASLVDSLLPVVLIGGIRLRYILKDELLLDPALDIAGNRLPNYFLDRRAPDFERELQGIRELAASTGPDEGLVIFPEGTRFSEAKQLRIATRNRDRAGPIAEMSRAYRRVLPPRPAGTLALIESIDADVVVLAHRGLEGFATVADIWSGGLVGSVIEVHLWRVSRQDVPEGRASRVEWLYRLWAEVDEWVVSGRRQGSVLDG